MWVYVRTAGLCGESSRTAGRFFLCVSGLRRMRGFRSILACRCCNARGTRGWTRTSGAATKRDGHHCAGWAFAAIFVRVSSQVDSPRDGRRIGSCCLKLLAPLQSYCSSFEPLPCSRAGAKAHLPIVLLAWLSWRCSASPRRGVCERCSGWDFEVALPKPRG
jgi:hypothetical protein